MAGEFTGKLIADKYNVGRSIASAGLGELYEGTNILVEKPVSISILSEEMSFDAVISARFFAEARSAAKVSHPNVLNLLDFGTSGGIAFAVYEPAAGETLSAAVSREGRLPVDLTAEIALQIASALSAAHAAGVVHGNLHPGSVLASSREPGIAGVKVFGFGTANAIGSDRRDDQDPVRFAYLAPELCSGSEADDPRVDIYSLGAIFFEMLSGAAPFEGQTPAEVLLRNIKDPPPPLSAFRQDLPPDFEPVILKAMAKDPASRYQNADEFISALTMARNGLAGGVTEAEPKNNIWKTAFVVLVGVSLLTIAMIYATSVKQTDPTTVLQPDANGRPVQPIYPATGVEEQNLANLPPEDPLGDANSNSANPPGAYPGGDGYNPWANGGAPPPGAPSIPPGGQVVTVPNGQSPFMADPNCILQPSGILLCPVPVTPTPTPKATPTPRSTPQANTNTATSPVATPSPPKPSPSKTPIPAKTPKPDPLEPKGS